MPNSMPPSRSSPGRSKCWRNGAARMARPETRQMDCRHGLLDDGSSSVGGRWRRVRRENLLDRDRDHRASGRRALLEEMEDDDGNRKRDRKDVNRRAPQHGLYESHSNPPTRPGRCSLVQVFLMNVRRPKTCNARTHSKNNLSTETTLRWRSDMTRFHRTALSCTFGPDHGPECEAKARFAMERSQNCTRVTGMRPRDRLVAKLRNGAASMG